MLTITFQYNIDAFFSAFIIFFRRPNDFFYDDFIITITSWHCPITATLFLCQDTSRIQQEKLVGNMPNLNAYVLFAFFFSRYDNVIAYGKLVTCWMVKVSKLYLHISINTFLTQVFIPIVLVWNFGFQLGFNYFEFEEFFHSTSVGPKCVDSDVRFHAPSLDCLNEKITLNAPLVHNQRLNNCLIDGSLGKRI